VKELRATQVREVQIAAAMSFSENSARTLPTEGPVRPVEPASIMQGLSAGVLIVDQHLNIVLANDCARDIMQRAGLADRQDGRLSGPAATLRRLQAIVVSLMKGATPDAILLNEHDSDPFIVLVAEALGLSSEAGSDWRGLLWLADLSDLQVDCRWVGQIFGLTRGEQQVLTLLASGHSPESIAEELGASVATVRTHLQRAYAKTGTGSQAKLVRLACAVPRRSRPQAGQEPETLSRKAGRSPSPIA
jgi:DNA-binding CsgD family transcriptional regulator